VNCLSVEWTPSRPKKDAYNVTQDMIVLAKAALTHRTGLSKALAHAMRGMRGRANRMAAR